MSGGVTPGASAGALAAAVRSGERAAGEVVAAALAEIERRDGGLHAFNLVARAEAEAAAARVDAAVAAGRDPGPLAGVPIALKDNLCTKGLATTCSSRILDGWVPPYDATVVVRLQEAGAVVVGKTNMDEFAMGSSTEHSAFGPTRNPHDGERVPGGSSGGSAAAVGGGLVPLALGSDTGGSIRQPAAFCGVVGVKPTYGLVSRYGLVAFASSLDQIGPFATSVADAALLLEVIAGHDPKDATSLPGSAPVLSTRIDAGVEGLRIGLLGELVDGAAPDVRRAVDAAAEALSAAGAEVEATSIPDCRLGLSAYYLIAPAEASSNLARFDGIRFGLRVPREDVVATYGATRAAGFGREVTRRILLGTFALSAGYYDAYYGQAQRVRTRIRDAFDAAYRRFDLLLGATAPTTAFRAGERLADPLSMYLSDLFTIPSNLAGHPALSVPFGVGDDGLPVGVQLLGPALSEARLLAAAALLESGAPSAPGAGPADRTAGRESRNSVSSTDAG